MTRLQGVVISLHGAYSTTYGSGQGCVSLQVLQEFYVVVTRKITTPLSPQTAKQIVQLLSAWRVHEPIVDDLLRAIDFQQQHTLSFWDALILVSAQQCGCKIVWSEDFNSGQSYGDVIVRSPFTTDAAPMPADA